MAHQKLAPNQEEQIRKMRSEGKSPQECVDYMKETYGIKVPLWKISYIMGKGPDGYLGKKPGRKTSIGGGKAKRKYRRRAQTEERTFPDFNAQDVSIEQAVQEVVKGLQQISEGYKAIFMHLRLAVIKEAAKVFEIAKKNGIEIKGEDVKE